MNELLLLLSVVICFTLVLIFKLLFGKVGLYIWVAIAPIIANIFVNKNVDIFGISCTLGNVAFASSFLATDILNECYGFESSKKAVYIGIVSVLSYLLATQIDILFVANDIDYASSSMNVVFSQTARICFSSVVMYFLSNLLDVYLFKKLKELSKGKFLWLRNNVSTIVCNCFENLLFTFFAFAGVYSMKDILLITASTSVIEIFLALCDTPFVYLSKLKINSNNKFFKKILYNNDDDYRKE